MQYNKIKVMIQNIFLLCGIWMMTCISTGCVNSVYPEESSGELFIEDRNREASDEMTLEPDNSGVESEGQESTLQIKDSENLSVKSQDIIYVQVCGSVNQPGVYELKEGDRVFQAISLAGGMTEDAYVQSVNQARKVSDGELITIYTLDEWQQMSEDRNREAEDGININTADVGQLSTLPGIGEKIAGRIVEYRESNGAFQNIEQIKQVSGIGNSVYDKIKDRIRV